MSSKKKGKAGKDDSDSEQPPPHTPKAKIETGSESKTDTDRIMELMQKQFQIMGEDLKFNLNSLTKRLDHVEQQGRDTLSSIQTTKTSSSSAAHTVATPSPSTSSSLSPTPSAPSYQTKFVIHDVPFPKLDLNSKTTTLDTSQVHTYVKSCQAAAQSKNVGMYLEKTQDDIAEILLNEFQPMPLSILKLQVSQQSVRMAGSFLMNLGSFAHSVEANCIQEHGEKGTQDIRLLWIAFLATHQKPNATNACSVLTKLLESKYNVKNNISSHYAEIDQGVKEFERIGFSFKDQSVSNAFKSVVLLTSLPRNAELLSFTSDIRKIEALKLTPSLVIDAVTAYKSQFTNHDHSKNSDTTKANVVQHAKAKTKKG